jgi:hypothetical protein
VKKVLFAVLLSFTALSLVADPPLLAIVTSITPALGTVSGGDTIAIVVSEPLHSCPVCSPPFFYAEVTFGGVAARSVVAWDKTIFAVTPPHMAGTFDVVVTSQGTLYGSAKFTYAGQGSPVTASNYERVLVPLALPSLRAIPGAFGSQWSTEIWVSNQSEYPVEFFNDVTCTVVCQLFFAADPPYPQLAAKSVTKLEPLDAAGGAAFLYYVQKTYANDVQFSLHAADTSRSKENAGTEIGVVREGNFRGAAFNILNVPLDAQSRATLRLYDPDATDFAIADVDIYAMNGGALLSSSSIPLPLPVKRAQSPIALVIPPFAGFGQMTLPSTPAGRVRINVHMRNTTRGWGFVSVTNNATQLITTFRPE